MNGEKKVVGSATTVVCGDDRAEANEGGREAEGTEDGAEIEAAPEVP